MALNYKSMAIQIHGKTFLSVTGAEVEGPTSVNLT